MAATSAIESPAVDWLLSSDEPAVQYLTRRDVLGEEIDPDPEEILSGRWVRALLSGQQRDGGFGGHPYKKWTGAHWRLVSLVELAAPPGEPRLLAAAERVLAWLDGPGRRRNLKTIDGLVRRCASQEGNALAACSRLGMADDDRVGRLARSLVDWQWPDGGWNCDQRASGRRSSFHESLAPMWGLHEFAEATGADWAGDAALRTAELFLGHRLFRSLRTGEVIDGAWLAFHYPPYWHYDVLQALLILSRMGLVGDPRAVEALELVEQRRLPDGRWAAGSSWWRRPGSRMLIDVVDWGRRGPNVMITLNALRVLAAAR
ncbi:MAG TPA: hypothetical protein VFM13_12425 [Gaiellaceae bacterium]|nr:hypothetical protein [Gaiellaceae bacterium]